MTCHVMDAVQGADHDAGLSNLEALMMMFASPRFLRGVLWADAASCVASGALQLAALDALPRLLGLPQALLVDTGLFLVAYGLVAAWTATREAPPRNLIALFVLGNLAWAIGCGAVIALLQPTTLGVAWVAAQAPGTQVLAEGAHPGGRRGRGDQRDVHGRDGRALAGLHP